MATLFDLDPPMQTKASPATAGPAFDPAEWVVLPNGAGLPRSSLKPCGQCGGIKFEYRVFRDRKETGGLVEWSENCAIQCPACMPLQSVKKRDGVVVRTAQITRALISMRDGTITILRDRDSLEMQPEKTSRR